MKAEHLDVGSPDSFLDFQWDTPFDYEFQWTSNVSAAK